MIRGNSSRFSFQYFFILLLLPFFLLYALPLSYNCFPSPALSRCFIPFLPLPPVLFFFPPVLVFHPLELLDLSQFSHSFLSVLRVKTLFYLYSSLPLTTLTFTYFPHVSGCYFPTSYVYIIVLFSPFFLSLHITFHLSRSSFFSPSVVSYLLISFLKHSFSISFISPSYCHFSFGIFATAENGLVFPLSC